MPSRKFRDGSAKENYIYFGESYCASQNANCLCYSYYYYYNFYYYYYYYCSCCCYYYYYYYC